MRAEVAAYDAEATKELERAYKDAVATDSGRGLERTRPVSRAKYDYARALIDSGDRVLTTDALVLLQELVYCGYEPSMCLFAMALAHYRLGEMSESRKKIEHLLGREPDNKDALVFHRMLRTQVGRDGKLGLVMMAAAAVGALILLRVVMKRRSSSSKLKLYQ